MMTPLKPEPEIPSDEMRVLELSECNFRTVCAAEVESGDCESKYGARGTQHLRTPVALNPWLRRRTWLRRSDSYLIEAEVSVKLFALTRFALHSGLMNTYLTDPPCEECEVGMAFKSYHHYILVSATIRSDKPLTLGDVMDRTLVSKTWKLVTEHKPFRWPAKDTTLAEKIDELKKRDSLVAFEPCELKLKLKVNGTTNHALVLNSDQLQ
jgi:hypothetical protein